MHRNKIIQAKLNLRVMQTKAYKVTKCRALTNYFYLPNIILIVCHYVSQSLVKNQCLIVAAIVFKNIRKGTNKHSQRTKFTIPAHFIHNTS